MAMLGSSWKPTLRNLVAAPEAGPSSQRAPALGASAVAMVLPPIALFNCASKAPPSANGYCYNPEVGVGILAAFTDPAAAHLRVAEPIRAGARSILEMTSDLRCNDYCTTPYCDRRNPFRVAEFMLACNLCHHRMDGGSLYMYKGEMAFCKPECRYYYAIHELYKERQRRTGTPALTRVRRGKAKGKAPEADDDKGEGRMFFTYAEIP